MTNTDPSHGKLWTIRELAAFLGYTESTVQTLVSKKPSGLPPRVAALYRPRWDPDVVRAWIAEQSRGAEPVRRAGRRRAI
ncbi:MAG TPA: hypothetical protein VL752_17325 [Acidisoma sp.]|jgi:hypothetical protein|uniref:helix-turn-helix transcriptional regulator n=1 Tax=Acidisoma sp. TaxID=1872115 RepID=UPI002BAC49FE|nr:hypothetical protein [Acidisoma sp.]HTI02714.1 hypothetical protein [Acidisoma sp.]